MRRWAVIGAEQRLAQLAEEASAIYAAFPELRGRKGGRGNSSFPGRQASSGGADAAPRRRRRRLSPEARKRISDAQKARWAKQKKAAAK
jgi:hypothetical protein